MNINQKLNLENLKTNIINNNQEIEKISTRIDKLEGKIRRKEREQKRRQMHMKRRNKYLAFFLTSLIIALTSIGLGLTLPSSFASTVLQVISLITIFPIIRNLNYLYKENEVIKQIPHLSPKNMRLYEDEKENLYNLLEKYRQDNLQLLIKLNKESDKPVIPPVKREERVGQTRGRARVKNRH